MFGGTAICGGMSSGTRRVALGLRQSEVLGLGWTDVDLALKVLTVRWNRLRPRYAHGSSTAACGCRGCRARAGGAERCGRCRVPCRGPGACADLRPGGTRRCGRGGSRARLLRRGFATGCLGRRRGRRSEAVEAPAVVLKVLEECGAADDSRVMVEADETEEGPHRKRWGPSTSCPVRHWRRIRDSNS